jgi:hypothetical protein
MTEGGTEPIGRVDTVTGQYFWPLYIYNLSYLEQNTR